MKIGEQRNTKRLSVQGAVKLRTENDARRSVSGIVRDISIGGCLLYIDECVGLDQYVAVEVRLPRSSQRFCGRGIVRHENDAREGKVNSCAIGIQFVNPPAQELQGLMRQELASRDKTINRWRRRDNFRRLGIMLPFLALFGLLAGGVMSAVMTNMRNEASYQDRLREATIYYLMHS